MQIDQRDREARTPSIGTELGQIGADIIAQIRQADTARIAELEREVARLQKACRHIKPYLEWTISDESPGYHPTMPSAVGAFLAATTALGGQP